MRYQYKIFSSPVVFQKSCQREAAILLNYRSFQEPNYSQYIIVYRGPEDFVIFDRRKNNRTNGSLFALGRNACVVTYRRVPFCLAKLRRTLP